MLSGVGSRPPSLANSPIHVVPIRLTSGTSPPAMALTMRSWAASHGTAVTSTRDVGVLGHEVVGDDAEVVALGPHRPHRDRTAGLLAAAVLRAGVGAGAGALGGRAAGGAVGGSGVVVVVATAAGDGAGGQGRGDRGKAEGVADHDLSLWLGCGCPAPPHRLCRRPGSRQRSSRSPGSPAGRMPSAPLRQTGSSVLSATMRRKRAITADRTGGQIAGICCVMQWMPPPP